MPGVGGGGAGGVGAAGVGAAGAGVASGPDAVAAGADLESTVQEENATCESHVVSMHDWVVVHTLTSRC